MRIRILDRILVALAGLMMIAGSVALAAQLFFGKNAVIHASSTDASAILPNYALFVNSFFATGRHLLQIHLVGILHELLLVVNYQYIIRLDAFRDVARHTRAYISWVYHYYCFILPA